MAEAFICAYRRTPIGRFGGALASVRPDDLGAVPLRALIAGHAGVDWDAVDDVIFGCANQAGEDNRNVARMSLLLAGLPVGVSGTTINRLCGSGMDAVIAAARAIKAGEADLVIAGGAESMSRAPFVMPKAETAFSRNAEIYDTTIGWRFINPLMQAQYGVDSMPETGENVAADFAISRADQDAFALRSQQRAVTAQRNGRLSKEIVPVTIPRRKGEAVTIDTDEHPRADTTLETLARLPTPFRKGGSVTAGNASGGERWRRGADRRLGSGYLSTRPDAHGPHPRWRGCGRATAHHGHRPGTRDAKALCPLGPVTGRFRRR